MKNGKLIFAIVVSLLLISLAILCVYVTSVGIIIPEENCANMCNKQGYEYKTVSNVCECIDMDTQTIKYLVMDRR